jgi:membrane protease subunit HflC
MNRIVLFVAGALVIVLGITAFASMFVVRQTEQALVLQFGDPRRVVSEPGLKFKVPFIQNVVYFDKRLLEFDAPPEEVILSDQRRVIVDTYTRWRITDPLRFFQASQQGRESAFRGQLATFVTAAMRQVFGGAGLTSVLSKDRDQLMAEMQQFVGERAANFGVVVEDVRIRRADLPQENFQVILTRMQTERERVAREIRAQGAEVSQRIRAAADREREVLLAEADRESEQTRGEGDREAAQIYARAHSQDAEFYSFIRRLEAFRKSFEKGDSTLILSSEADLLQLFDGIEQRVAVPKR